MAGTNSTAIRHREQEFFVDSFRRLCERDGKYNAPYAKFSRGKKRGLVMNGFVADLSGKPLKGAYIGLRSPGTVYIAASAITDTNGYYEMNNPAGRR